ncbi:MAG: type II toxin-antitoxin system RelE/ParE family toxin [Acetatifactor sp.]|nr:type II toxin-antitoxin system RelE/ParE family toxin [Acetatifactor sp.]
MSWKVIYLDEAVDDLTRLDKSVRLKVLKGIHKVLQNPLPSNEGGYGKPLSNQSGISLAGFCKIKYSALGIRVVYKLECVDENMLIIVVSARENKEVYKEAQKRINQYRL